MSRREPGRTRPAAEAGEEPSPLTLRVDPWAPEYEGGLGLIEDDEEGPEAEVDLAVEDPDWQAVAPVPGPRPTFWIIDGVRRVELRVLADVNGATRSGLFGSLAVGAVRIGERAEIGRVVVSRALILGGGVRPPDTTVPSPEGSALEFAGVAVADTTPMAPLAGLQQRMRSAEALLAEELGRGGEFVVVDGPLTHIHPSEALIVGYVKWLHRVYLPPAALPLLGRLAVAARTPLFLIRDPGGRFDRYSWYVRLAPRPGIAHPYAGVARLEISAAVGLAEAAAVADMSARTLPGLASTPERDPRAPQNLVPVGALEQHLRHRLGDPAWIRRLLLRDLTEAQR